MAFYKVYSKEKILAIQFRAYLDFLSVKIENILKFLNKK
jgi:hypothetical protein